MRPAGTDLARRWLAALLVAPESEREAIVEAVERRVVEEFGAGLGSGGGEVLLDVAEAPVQRDGYVEQIIRTYAPSAERENGEDGRGRSERTA